MRYKYLRSQSIILLACINWCCHYSQNTKELGYFRKIKTKTKIKLCCFPKCQGHFPRPHLAKQASREGLLCMWFIKDKLPGKTNKGAWEAGQDKQRSSSKGVEVSGEVQGVESRNVSYASELSQRLWVSGQGCLGEEVPGHLAFCSLRKVAPVAWGWLSGQPGGTAVRLKAHWSGSGKVDGRVTGGAPAFLLLDPTLGLRLWMKRWPGLRWSKKLKQPHLSLLPLLFSVLPHGQEGSKKALCVWLSFSSICQAVPLKRLFPPPEP